MGVSLALAKHRRVGVLPTRTEAAAIEWCRLQMLAISVQYPLWLYGRLQGQDMSRTWCG